MYVTSRPVLTFTFVFEDQDCYRSLHRQRGSPTGFTDLQIDIHRKGNKKKDHTQQKDNSSMFKALMQLHENVFSSNFISLHLFLLLIENTNKWFVHNF